MRASLVLVVLLALGLLSFSAAAQDSPRPRRALRELPELDCMTSLRRVEIDQLKAALRGRAGDAAARQRLSRLLDQVARTPGWDAASLAQIAYPASSDAGEAGHRDDPVLVWAWSLVEAAARAKPSAGCKELSNRLRQRANDLATDDFDALSSACQKFPERWEADAVTGGRAPKRHVQAVFTHVDVDRLLAVTDGHVMDLRQEHSLDVKEARAFLVPVREGSPITLRAFIGQRHMTHAMLLRSTEPVALMFEEERTACIDLQLSADPKDRVHAFLAGVRLEPGPNRMYLPPPGLLERAPALLKVLSERGGVPKDLEARALTWAEISMGSEQRGCYRLRLDLTRQPSDEAVAIVTARVGGSCLSNGLDEAELQARADQALRRIGWQSRPARQWAALIGDFSQLMSTLDRRREVGGARGLLDTTLRFEQGASEARRQGFSKLLSLEVGCAPRIPSDQVTIRATVLALEQIAPHADELMGLDLSKAQRSKVAVVPGVESLDAGLTAVLTQLHDSSAYLRLSPSATAWRFAGGARLNVLTYVPSSEARASAHKRQQDEAKRHITLKSVRLLDDQHYLCRAANDRSSVVHEWWKQQERSTPDIAEDREDITVSPGVEVSRTVMVQPSRPGLHMIRAELLTSSGGHYGRASDDPTTVGYQCVSVIEPRLALALDFGYATGTRFRSAPDARHDDLGYGRLLASALVQKQERTAFVYGLSLGYANAVHTLSAPPTWELGDGGSAPTYDRDGQLTTAWTRQSLLFGPLIAYRMRAIACRVGTAICGSLAKRFGLLFRLVPLLDVGKISAESVPPELTHFTQNSDGLDLDLTTMLDAGIEVNLTSSTSMYALVGGSFVGWDDLILGGRDQRLAMGRVTYDAHTVVGVSLGLAVSP